MIDCSGRAFHRMLWAIYARREIRPPRNHPTKHHPNATDQLVNHNKKPCKTLNIQIHQNLSFNSSKLHQYSKNIETTKQNPPQLSPPPILLRAVFLCSQRPMTDCSVCSTGRSFFQDMSSLWETEGERSTSLKAPPRFFFKQRVSFQKLGCF